MGYALYERARLLFDQGRWPMAADALRAYIAAFPQDAGAHAMLAIALANTSPAHGPAALAASDESLRLAAGDAYCLYARAVVSLYTDVTLAPEGPRAMRTGVVFRLRTARYFAQLAVAADPAHLPSWRMLARIALDLNEPAAMRGAAVEALRYAPTDVPTLGLLARSFEIAGEHSAALATAEAGLAIAPDDATLQSVRAWALLQRGNDVAAEHGFLESLRIDPTDDVTQKGLSEARRNQQVAGKWWQVRWSEKPRRLRSNQVTTAQASSAGVIVAILWAASALTRTTTSTATNNHASPPPTGTSPIDPIFLGLVAIVTVVGVLIYYFFRSSRWK